MSGHLGRTIMRYIDEQAEAIIESGGTVERIEMDRPHFDALKRYADTQERQHEVRAHPDVPVVVKDGSKVVVIACAATAGAEGGEEGSCSST